MMDNNQSEINNLLADKICLDQALVQQMNICHELRKQSLLKDKYIEDINSQVQKLLQEKADLQAEIEKIKVGLSNSIEPIIE